ncbi:MAG: hypothetical protein CSB15_01680 [Clostridiales bacterium]|nr:MAG: hypothetical protein CSB15_01680 [Clostridiales bacterium]
MKKFNSYFIIFMFLITFFSVSFAENNTTINKKNNKLNQNKTNSNKNTVSLKKALDKQIKFNYLLYDNRNNLLLNSNNADVSIPMGEMTTLMTTLIILESKDVNAEFVANDKFVTPKGSSIGIVPKEKLKVVDLLYAINLKSANDATKLLAESSAKNLENFTKLMNKKAKELNLKHTVFVTPYATADTNQTTSLNDLKIIIKRLLKFDKYKKIAKAKKYEILPTNLTKKKRTVVQDNDLVVNNQKYYLNGKKNLLIYDEMVEGLKLSNLKGAGSILASYKIVDRTPIIAINYTKEFNSNKIYADNKYLLNGEAGKYKVVTIVNKGDVLKKIPKNDKLKKSVELISKEKFVYVFNVNNVNIKDVKKDVILISSSPEFILDSTKKNTKIGDLKISVKNKLIKTIPLFSRIALKKGEFVGSVEKGVNSKKGKTVFNSKVMFIFKLLISFILWIFVLGYLKNRERKKIMERKRREENIRSNVIDFDLYRKK